MKKRNLLIIGFLLLFVAAIVIALSLPKNTSPESFSATEQDIFGTYLSVKLFLEEKTQADAQNDFNEMVAMLRSVESRISSNEVRYPKSDIVRFNNSKEGERTEISSISAQLTKLCLTLYEDTEGYFNPAVYYGSDYWGFDNGYGVNNIDIEKPWKTKETVVELLPLSDFSKVRIEEIDEKYFLVKDCPSVSFNGKMLDMKIDYGGIGKGYAADLAKSFLEEKGYTGGFVSIGGSSIVLLENSGAEDSLWEITYINPRSEETNSSYYASSKEKNCAVSSSGDYQNYYIADNDRYCHIIDKTLCPIDNGFIMSSVITNSAAVGDALSTTLMLLGFQATEFCEKYADKYGITAWVTVADFEGEYIVYGTLDVRIRNNMFKKDE